MQWDKAKNYMLIFFIIANVLLAALIRYETSSHILTRERVDAIYAVFAQNNITMYHQIPRNFAPMRYLQLSTYGYDTDRLLSIFLDADAETTHRSEPGRDEFVQGNTRLVITGGNVFFISGKGVTGVPDKDSAIALTSEFIAEHYPDFRLDIHSTREALRGGLRLFYRQEYQGHLIHSNLVEFLITGEGDNLVIEEVDIHYSQPVSFVYMPRELAGPDEALLTFVQHVRRQEDAPIIIAHMDIAYVRPILGGRDAYVPIYAVPFYRIFIEGSDQPFLINAYTNRVML